MDEADDLEAARVSSLRPLDDEGHLVEVPRAGSAPVLFETQGVALQDVAAAGLAWERLSAGNHHTTHTQEH